LISQTIRTVCEIIILSRRFLFNSFHLKKFLITIRSSPEKQKNGVWLGVQTPAFCRFAVMKDV